MGLTKRIKLSPFKEREADYAIGIPIFKKQQLPNKAGGKKEVPRVTLAN